MAGNELRENEKEKFYLNWYYENFKSISKAQARTIFYIFLLCFFSFSLIFRNPENANDYYTFPIIGIEIGIDFLYYVLPLAITLVVLQFTGSLRSAKFAIENIEYRLNKLNWLFTQPEEKSENSETGHRLNELRLYDIDTNLNFFDYLIYNFRGYYSPGQKEPEKNIPNFKELPYVVFALFYLSTKVIMYYEYPYHTVKYWSYFKYVIIFSFIIDVIVSLPLIISRLKNFFRSFKNLANIRRK